MLWSNVVEYCCGVMLWKSFEYRNSCNNGIYKYVFAQIIINLNRE